MDGVMGVESRIAVREFQKKQGLPVTGFVGPDTEQALVAATRSTGGATAEPATSSGGDGNGQGPATDDSELLTELGISPELGLESEFEFGNILELELDRDRETGGDTRIIDLTAKANKSLRKGMRDPKKVDTLVLHQMACCFKVKDPMTRFLKNMAPHFAILADGRILQFHPTQALTWASNGFNTNSVAVEFAGNFPSTKGKWWLDRKYLQTLTKAQAQAYIKANQNRVTPEQIEAGRYLVKHLIRTMGLKKVVSHRQSSNTRENDPGPDIWYHVGQWAIENLGLSDGGSGYKVGTGAAIPDIWRTWGRKATQQPELLAEFMEAEAGVEVAALGVAVFEAVESICNAAVTCRCSRMSPDTCTKTHPHISPLRDGASSSRFRRTIRAMESTGRISTSDFLLNTTSTTCAMSPSACSATNPAVSMLRLSTSTSKPRTTVSQRIRYQHRLQHRQWPLGSCRSG